MTMKYESPWDSLDAYNLPVQTDFDVVQDTPIMIAIANPMRVMMAIAYTVVGLQGSPEASISIDPNVRPRGGFAIGLYSQPFVMCYKQWGPALTSAWYVTADGTQSMTISVLEVTAREWPGSRDFRSLIQQADDGKFR